MAKAERIVAEELGRLGWRETRLMRRPINWVSHDFKGLFGHEFSQAELQRLKWSGVVLGREAKTHPKKLALAARLRRKTTLTVREIASRLLMGSRKSLNHQLYLARQTKGQSRSHKSGK